MLYVLGISLVYIPGGDFAVSEIPLGQSEPCFGVWGLSYLLGLMQPCSSGRFTRLATCSVKDTAP